MTGAEISWGQLLSWAEGQGGERRYRLVAPSDVREALARDLELEDLQVLEADLRISPWLDGVRIAGRVSAVAGRLCGLTLERFDEAIDEELSLRLVPRGSPNAPVADAAEVIIDLDDEDPPEAVPGDSIDLTAYVVEAFSLALDPFPRKPGAVFASPDPVGVISPFAGLAGWGASRKEE